MSSSFMNSTMSSIRSVRSQYQLNPSASTTTQRLWLRSGIGATGIDPVPSWYDGSETWPLPSYWDPTIAATKLAPVVADQEAFGTLATTATTTTALVVVTEPGNDRNKFTFDLYECFRREGNPTFCC